MKKEDVKKAIIKEAIYIKSLMEEKAQIEEALSELDCRKELDDEGTAMSKDGGEEIESEGLSTSTSLKNKKSMPKRLEDPHRLKSEGTTELDEIHQLRKAIRKQLSESLLNN